MSGLVYECKACGRKVTAQDGDPVPTCCRKVMEPLPFCTTKPDPELARNAGEDEPCADGSERRHRS